VLQAIRRNFGLKLLALALAVTAWAYFHFSAAPSITAHFDQQLSVPIVVSGLRPGLVASYDERTAFVTVEVPRNGPPVKPDQVQAVLDLNAKPDPGIMNLPVTIVAPDVVIRSLSPASVTLSVDRLETRTVPVSIAYTGGNGSLVVESSTVNPTTTTVRGIANDLAKVEAVKIEIPLGTKPGSFDAMVRPVAADAQGNEVGNTQVSPNLVRVRARFVPSTNSAGVKS
jgi:YbbR domain-containing protein